MFAFHLPKEIFVLTKTRFHVKQVANGFKILGNQRRFEVF